MRRVGNEMRCAGFSLRSTRRSRRSCAAVRPISSMSRSMSEIGRQALGLNEIFWSGQMAPAKGFPEAAQALAPRPDVRTAADQGDAAMAELDQMFGRLRHAERVVGEDGVHLEGDFAVEKDRR